MSKIRRTQRDGRRQLTRLATSIVLIVSACPAVITDATRATLSFSILPRLFARRAGSSNGLHPLSSPSSATPTTTSLPATEINAPFPPPSEFPTSELGFSFSPAGLLFPYHLGVASVLREKRLITDQVPLGGSSAGALVAVLIGSDISMKKALDACHTINNQWSGAMSFTGVITENLFNFDFGGGAADSHEEAVAAALAAGVTLPPSLPPSYSTRLTNINGRRTLKALLEEVLDQVLPPDAHERLNARPGKVTVGVTNLGWSGFRANFFLRPRAISSFASRADLIEVLLASCNVPVLFAGYPSLPCRGLPSIDGYFSVPAHRFGCPYLAGAARTILVSPFPATAVMRGPGPTAEEEGGREWLSPEVEEGWGGGREEGDAGAVARRVVGEWEGGGGAVLRVRKEGCTGMGG
ncbi:patatin-like phospholipase domain-containing protein [Nannochloropsis gaditana CCMP526]|uniref:patatin-like phospholipase domain-containing protein n=1 Tax=Nannochloropsis gaditana (strain CCMP526) TaxID=1093141 RepID=UPI00029F4FB3|nr:patatin-like phospholipase domain-containing protein [Nannochloropsis gaditana CCMP526]EKU22687.1 patatin-like phospholipase domain-containing protein [Nannochloropsis gaditana CCMP526]|eukprot:XP_005853673.1 patatin-like phospholipase domain-containing protein [Nannochloropsis gaditana CCMP526]